MSIKKEFKELLREVEAQDGTIKKIKSGYQVLAPNGIDIVTLHATPSDRRHSRMQSRSYAERALL